MIFERNAKRIIGNTRIMAMGLVGSSGEQKFSDRS